MAQVGIPRWCSAWPRSLVDKTLAWRAPKGSADGAPPRSHPPSGLATASRAPEPHAELLTLSPFLRLTDDTRSHDASGSSRQ